MVVNAYLAATERSMKHYYQSLIAYDHWQNCHMPRLERNVWFHLFLQQEALDDSRYALSTEHPL